MDVKSKINYSAIQNVKNKLIAGAFRNYLRRKMYAFIYDVYVIL